MSLYLSASGIINGISRYGFTANNIANLRTPGFRAQTVQNAPTPGGGVAIGQVSRDNAPGPIETTNRPLDLGQNDAFFRIRLADGSLGYTRDGAFGLNRQGQVVSSSGAPLDPPVSLPQNATSITVSRDGAIFAASGSGVPRQVGQIEVFQFPNPGGLEPIGGNIYLPTTASGDGAPVRQDIVSGVLSQSNVSLAREQANAIETRASVRANAAVFRAQNDILGELLNLES